MKIKALCASLFAIVVLVANQVSFGMERKLVCIPTVCEAKKIDVINLGEISVNGVAFDPLNKNKILLISSEGCKSYDLQSKNIENKELSDDKDKIAEFIKTSSDRPKLVGPYSLNYDDKNLGNCIMLGNIVMIFDTKTKSPLYTITHNNNTSIQCATFNADRTKLITVSGDNIIKISEIKKPIIIECDETYTVISPDIVCTSKYINSDINFPRSDKSSISTVNFEGVSAENFNQIILLMALVYKKEIDQIKKKLSTLDFNSLCNLAEMCDPLLIAHENIHLTDIICECIAHKYESKRNYLRVKQLPPYCENIITKHAKEKEIREARVGAQNLSGFFDKPFFHKKW